MLTLLLLPFISLLQSGWLDTNDNTRKQEAWFPPVLYSNHRTIKVSLKGKILHAFSCKGLKKKLRIFKCTTRYSVRDLRFNHPSPCPYRDLSPAVWETGHRKVLTAVLFHRKPFFSQDTIVIFARKEHLTWESSASNFCKSVVAITCNCSTFSTGKSVSGKYTEHWQLPWSSREPVTLAKSCKNKAIMKKKMLMYFSRTNS